jgi:hypothetical protein
VKPGADEPVGLDADGLVDPDRVGRDRLVEVGPVGRRRSVPGCAQRRQVALEVGPSARTLEQQVFQQVGHAGLAIALELAAGLDQQLDPGVAAAAG